MNCGSFQVQVHQQTRGIRLDELRKSNLDTDEHRIWSPYFLQPWTTVPQPLAAPRSQELACRISRTYYPRHRGHLFGGQPPKVLGQMGKGVKSSKAQGNPTGDEEDDAAVDVTPQETPKAIDEKPPVEVEEAQEVVAADSPSEDEDKA